jgi:hypothetical protein
MPELRSTLAAFADEMEDVLRRHDGKTDWKMRPVEALVRKMMLEVKEFECALEFFEVSDARKELIDIANYCLIVWDRLSLLEQNETMQNQREVRDDYRKLKRVGGTADG